MISLFYYTFCHQCYFFFCFIHLFLFESIKGKSKKSYFSKKMLQYKNNMKKSCSVMKEIIGKMHQHNKLKLPRRLFVDKKYIFFRERQLKGSINFSQILVHLLQERFLLRVSSLKVFWKKTSTALPERCRTIKELKDAFFSLKKYQCWWNIL